MAEQKSQTVAQKKAKQQIQGKNPFYQPDEEQRNGVVLTSEQVAKMFDVTLMSIYNWRMNRNLPYYHLPGGAKPPVRYDEGLVLHWSEVHNVPIYNEDYKR